MLGVSKMRASVPIPATGRRVVLASCLGTLACGADVTEATTAQAASSGTTAEDEDEDDTELGTTDPTDRSDVGGSRCGDGVVQEGEECDGEDLGDVTCQTYGYEDGIITCSPNCRAITNACWTCGDGTLHPAKICDGEQLRDETCETLGFAGGPLHCKEDCRGYDTSSCEAFPTCGNGVLDPGEQCDGDLLADHTCASFGFDQGTLSCSRECVFDTSDCDYEPLDCGTQGSFCWSNAQCCPAGVGGNHLGDCYGFCT
jgi:hypothetical protein